MIFLGDFSFVRIFLKNYRVTMTTTLEPHVRKIQWFCQQGEGFCMHVFSSLGQIISTVLGQVDHDGDMVTLPEPQSGAKRPKLTTPKNDALAIVLSTKP